MPRRLLIAGLVLAELALCAVTLAVAWSAAGALRAGGLRLPPAASAAIEARDTLEQRFAVSGPAALEVANHNGSITITAAPGSEIVVTAQRRAWGADQAEAEARLAALQASMTLSGDTLTVEVAEPPADEDVFGRTQRSGAVEFTIQVPVSTTVTASTGFGAVQLSGTTGAVDLRSAAGDVSARGVDGSVELRSDFGDLALDNAAASTVRAHTSSGSVRLRQVRASGAVELSTRFGDVVVESGQAGRLAGETSSGSVTLSDLAVAGLLTAQSDFGPLTLTGAAAEAYDLSTSSGNVQVLDPTAGPLTVRTDFGSITISNAVEAVLDAESSSGSLSFSGSLAGGPHRLSTDFGDVDLTLPEASAFDVDLSTGFGRIQSDFAVTLSGATDEDHWVGRLNGGGAGLTVHTSSGDIRLLQQPS